MWIKNRAREPSTWAGLGVILQGLGAVFPAWAAVLHGLTVISGGVAILAKENGGA